MNTTIEISNETSIDTDDSSNDSFHNKQNDTSDEYKSEMDIKKIRNTEDTTPTKGGISFKVDIHDCNYGEKPFAEIVCHVARSDIGPAGATGNLELSCPQFAHKYRVELDSVNPFRMYWTLQLNENLELGLYKVDLYYPGDKKYNPWSGSTYFMVKYNADPNLDIHIDDALYTEEVNVTIKANESLNGHVGVRINDGHTYGFEVVNGLAQGSISGLAPGNYTAKAIFKGDYTFAESEKTTTFTVKENPNPKTRPYLSVHIKNSITDFEPGTIQINTNESLSGDVKVNVISLKESRNRTVKVVNGVGKYYINTLTPGNYTVVATFDGNDKFKPVANSTTFNVRERDTPNLSIDAVGNAKADKTEIKIQTNANLSNPVDIKLNNSQEYYLKLENGSGTLTIDDLPGGEYTAIVRYNGDIYYKPAENTTQFTRRENKDPNLRVQINETLPGQKPVAEINKINMHKTIFKGMSRL